MGQHESSRDQAQLVQIKLRAQLADIRAKAARMRRRAELVIHDAEESQRRIDLAIELEEEAASIERQVRAAQAILASPELRRVQKAN